MLKLYHGSNVLIEDIDLKKGHINKDFGKGFYLTSIHHQAVEMAIRKAKQFPGTTPHVTEFLLDDSCLTSGELKVKIFDGVSEEWAQFILLNRHASRNRYKHDFDIVIGPVADDGVVQQLELYEMHIISLSQLVDALKYRNINDQYFFGTTLAISKLKKA